MNCAKNYKCSPTSLFTEIVNALLAIYTDLCLNCHFVLNLISYYWLKNRESNITVSQASQNVHTKTSPNPLCVLNTDQGGFCVE